MDFGFGSFFGFNSFAAMDCSQLKGKFQSYSKFNDECVDSSGNIGICPKYATVTFEKNEYTIHVTDTLQTEEFVCDSDEGKITVKGQNGDEVRGYFNSQAHTLILNGIWYHW